MKTSSLINITAIVIGGLVILNIGRTTYDLSKKGDRLSRLEKEVVDLTAQKQALEQKSVAVEQPSFIEQQARDLLHMVRPGEKIVILPEVRGQRSEVGSQNVVVGETPVWKQWLLLIFS